jgi:hypothetical protein
MTPRVHIYPLSRLVHAPAGAWEAELRKIEESKTQAYRYYLPLREAAIACCKTGGARLDSILERLTRSAAAVVAPRGSNPISDNRAAFNVFVEQFYPQIASFGESLLHDESNTGCEFHGVKLIGLPHFSATDKKGRQRYVYIHASKWDEDDLKAYLELLSIIIDTRFHAAPDSIWCMGVRTGKDFKWRPSQRLRGKCASAAQHYARMFPTTQSPIRNLRAHANSA